jgi:5-oxoprolinase (ATP-hydrolysing) subunit A
VTTQVTALADVCSRAGARLRHVKPHGALYNRAARDQAVAETIATAIRRASPELILVGLAGSALVGAGVSAGLQVASEAFADRAYEPDGSLRSRRRPGAIIATPAAAAKQAVSIVRDGRVTALDGTVIAVRADTICIHGDTPGAAEYVAAVRAALDKAGVTIAAIGR